MATIFGTNGADALRGTATADAIHGLWGDDSIEGVEGRDFLYGGNGNDTLDGGAGTDFIDGGGHFDTVLYASNTTPVWADLRTGAVSFLGQRWAPETLVSVEAIDGGRGNDRFIGDGAANHFWGSSGHDTLIGNVGSDTLLGGGGADSLDGGKGGDSLVGSFGDDTMRGGAHEDVFSIGPIVRLDPPTLALVDFGRDVIDGGAGTDTLFVDGPETFVYDDYEGGSEFGEDFGAPTVRANLGAGTLRIGDSDNRSTLISIENIETGSGDDFINGSPANNFIQAGDGANVVYAGAGDDTIIGGSRVYPRTNGSSDVELLNGGDGDDAIYGMGSRSSVYFGKSVYPGEDILAGGNGNDTLYGGYGVGDGAAILTMSGGAGDDVFVLPDRVANDGSADAPGGSFPPTTITDFERWKDTIRLDTDRALHFVGATSPADLEDGEVGYRREGSDTLIDFRGLDPYGDDLFTVVLIGHIGRLSASDFDLG